MLGDLADTARVGHHALHLEVLGVERLRDRLGRHLVRVEVRARVRARAGARTRARVGFGLLGLGWGWGVDHEEVLRDGLGVAPGER